MRTMLPALRVMSRARRRMKAPRKIWLNSGSVCTRLRTRAAGTSRTRPARRPRARTTAGCPAITSTSPEKLPGWWTVTSVSPSARISISPSSTTMSGRFVPPASNRISPTSKRRSRPSGASRSICAAVNVGKVSFSGTPGVGPSVLTPPDPTSKTRRVATDSRPVAACEVSRAEAREEAHAAGARARGQASGRARIRASRSPVRRKAQTPTERKRRLERETGIEPATSTLARWRSTAELFPLGRRRIAKAPGPVKAGGGDNAAP